MSQHDYIIADASGSAFLVDLNLAVKALAENNYGTTEPAVMYAHMWWADTTADILKKRNAANTGWISYLTLSTGAPLVTTGAWSGTAAVSTHIGSMSRSTPTRVKNTTYTNSTAYSICVSITVFLATSSEVWLQIAPTSGTRLDEQSNYSGSGEKRTLSGWILPGETYGLYEQSGTVTIDSWTETT